MSQLHNIEDKARYENAFFAIGRCAETFYLFAPNIPKNLCEITQHIHGRFDEALYYVFRASNSYDIEETRRLVSVKLAEVNMRLNERKSVITKAEYGVDFLGIRIKPFYSVLTGRRISRLWYTSRRFRNIEHAYISCASRKGMFNRYHGKRVSERWYNSLPEYCREHLKMDTNARFHLVGKQALPDKKILRNICLYDGQGENECMTSMKTAL